MDQQQLVSAALQALKNAYAPYSHFCVGAALLGKSGKVYAGCNVENASFGATMCAERVALFQAVCNGERDFEAIAVVGAREGQVTDFCPPCGLCRQALSEFSKDGNLAVILWNGAAYRELSLGELLPESFCL